MGELTLALIFAGVMGLVAIACAVGMVFYANAVADARKELRAAELELAKVKAQQEDFAKVKVEMAEAAKASVLKAGSELSNKLLADHKREQEEARKVAEQQTMKTTATLQEQFKLITDKVAALVASDGKQDRTIDTLIRALSTPGEAGVLSEIGLAGMLRALGLQDEIDFKLQHTVSGHEDGSRLRPDCIIFLPQGRAMVIDSKASKFALEIAAARTEEERREKRASLTRSMNEHVKALASKDYEGAVRKTYKEMRGDTLTQIYNVMYVPTESVLEHIRESDPEFIAKAHAKNLIPASPGTLYGLLAMARFTIISQQQVENQHVIAEAVKELMDGVVMAFTHAGKVGDALKNAVKHWDGFSGSTNRFVLSRMKKLHKLGVAHSKQPETPQKLPGYELLLRDETITLEAEETTISRRLTTV